MRLESVLEHGTAIQILLLDPAASKNDQYLRMLHLVKDSNSSYHTRLMDTIVALLDSRNADEIEDLLSVVSKARLKGAEMCLCVLDSCRQVSPDFAQVVLAANLRAGDLSEPDRLALRKVAKLFGIDLDAEGNPSKGGLREAANGLHEQYLKLMTEAQRLENLRLSLQALTPQSVSELLVRLHIETPSVIDDTIASLHSSLGSLIERISDDELELQFPATSFTRLQRFAIGAGDAESFLIRLTLGHDGAPAKFCIHLSGESSDHTKSRVSSNGKGHTLWEVFRGNNRPPHEHYCRDRPNRGVY